MIYNATMGNRKEMPSGAALTELKDAAQLDAFRAGLAMHSLRLIFLAGRQDLPFKNCFPPAISARRQ